MLAHLKKAQKYYAFENLLMMMKAQGLYAKSEHGQMKIIKKRDHHKANNPTDLRYTR